MDSRPLPLWLRIAEILIRDIASGRFPDGARLPPERVLAAEFGTTVTTLRKALAELAKGGMLERRQGSGNYVRATGVARGVYGFFRLELLEGGGLPTAELLSLMRATKPPDLPDFGTSAEASHIRRLRRIGGQAVAVEEIWLDGDAGVLEPPLSESLYREYRRIGITISRVEDRVGVAALPAWSPLALPPGTPAGYVERRAWADGPVPVEVSRSWFDPGRAVYVQRMV